MSQIMTTVYMILACHAVGDYVLQGNYLARTKGKNVWNLLMHCLLYSAPFAVVFGVNWKVLIIFLTHVVIDYPRANKEFGYAADQIMHMVVAVVLYLVPVIIFVVR